MTARFRLDLAYDGTRFAGWARQPDLRTVQGELEAWIPRVLRLHEPTPVTVAGRTDAGVHARGQVAHVDLPSRCDARFSAVWRRYCYRLWDAPESVDPLRRVCVAMSRHALDVPAMHAAGQSLVGLHDFAAFCRPRPGATTIRALHLLAVTRLPDGTVEVDVRADAFCHSMVRSVVGALVAVGDGSRAAAWLDGLLRRPDRAGDVFVMAPRGLTLEEVGYPPDADLGERATVARSIRSLPGGPL